MQRYKLMTFLPTQDKKGRGKSLSPLRKRPSTVAAQGQKDSCGKSRIKPRSPHAPNCIRYSQGKGTFFPAIFYIRSERSETDSGEIRLSTDRRYGIELFGSVSPQGEFLTQTTKIPVSTKFSTRVSTEITSAGPPKLYPSAMKITPAPTSPRVNIPIERARRSLNFRSR